MSYVDAPPRIIDRPLSPTVQFAATSAGFTPLQARLIAARVSDEHAGALGRLLSPALSDLDNPETLPDIDLAAGRIAQAVVRREPIVLLTDFDADGATSHAVMLGVLTQIFGHPRDLVHSYIGRRMTEGYGVSDGVTQRILDEVRGPGLVVTADQGTADENRIRTLREHGWETVITDHHGCPAEGPPKSAIACVNPNVPGSVFPDPLIAGVHTAWLTLAATRAVLAEIGALPNSDVSMRDYLCLDAVGTTADCVSFARSRNNRAVVRYGLARMNREPRPCWQAMREVLGKKDDWTAQDLGWLVGPRINAAGRLDDALKAVAFLHAADVATALPIAQQLHALNTERQEIERSMRDTGMALARGQVAAGRAGLCVYFDSGHAGVHGISAGRLAEHFGRPTLCLSPRLDDLELLSGSARSAWDCDVRAALAVVASELPDGVLKHGGHRAAGGITVRRSAVPALEAAWDRAIGAQRPVSELGPVVWTDGPIGRPLHLSLLAEIEAVAPFGRDFESPVFAEQVRIERVTAMGDGTHLRLHVRDASNRPFQAVWFRAVTAGQDAPVVEGQSATLALSLSPNSFRGETRVEAKVAAGIAHTD